MSVFCQEMAQPQALEDFQQDRKFSNFTILKFNEYLGVFVNNLEHFETFIVFLRKTCFEIKLQAINKLKTKFDRLTCMKFL